MLIFALFSHSYQSLSHLGCHSLQFKRCAVQSLLPARPPYYSYLPQPPAPKAATTEAAEATAQHARLSGAPVPIYSACLSRPPIQALKCLVKFTEAHHLLHWGNVQILTQSPRKNLKERVQRKQGHDLQCNSRTSGEKCLRTSELRCSEVNNGHLRDVFTTARRTIINDFSFQTATESRPLYSAFREQ